MVATELTAVYLVGGEGSRLKPYTDTMPKTMINIAGMPLISRIMVNLAPLFVTYDTKHVFLTSHKGEHIENYIRNAEFVQTPSNDQITSLLLAKEQVEGALLVYYGDTIIDTRFHCVYFAHDQKHNVAFVNEVEDVSKYCKMEAKLGWATSITEKPAGKESGWTVVGGYYLHDGNHFLSFVEENAKYFAEIDSKNYLSTAVNAYIRAGNKMRACKVKRHFSVDTMEDWTKVSKYYKEKEK